MALSGYDGEIRIDTKIDETGFNKGVSSLTSGLSKVGIAAKGMLKAISLGSAALLFTPLIIALLALKVLIVLMVASITSAFRQSKANTTNEIKGIKDSLLELKVAFADAFSPLITVALPYIQLVINWLTRMFNLVAMIVGAFLGQSEVMQVVVGSGKAAANNMGNLAKNTEKVTKAAKGALAAFDQLNVLAIPEESPQAANATGGATPVMDTVMTEIVPISNKVLTIVDAIKNAWEELKKKWVDAMVGWKKLISFMINLGEIGRTFIQGLLNTAWKFITNTATAIWDFVEGIFRLIIDVLNAFWNLFYNLNSEGWAKFKVAMSEAWSRFSDTAKDSWERVKQTFRDAWASVKSSTNDAFNSIKEIFAPISAWFWTTVGDPIRRGFATALTSIGQNFSTVFDGIYNTVASIVNNIISVINNMTQSVATAINTLITTINRIPGVNLPSVSAPVIPSISTNVRKRPAVPRFATGAVIPPNSEFAAILGDQKSGRNFEAPESLLRQIVREESGGTQGQKVTIEFTGTLAALVRELHPIIKQEDIRKGTSLIQSVST